MPEKRVRSTNKVVLVFGAHSDDFVIGAGGTIAKYILEKKKVISIVFSYGEMSHPWLKEKFVQKMRSKEAYDASKLLKCKTIFFNLKENRFLEEYTEKKMEPALIKILERYKPTKIFTHSGEDPHPDHKVVCQIILQIVDKLSFKPEIYTYSIWNPLSYKNKYPKMYEDITSTFPLKLKALKIYRSQRYNAVYPLLLMIYYRALRNGFKIGKKFAEQFYRVR